MKKIVESYNLCVDLKEIPVLFVRGTQTEEAEKQTAEAFLRSFLAGTEKLR